MKNPKFNTKEYVEKLFSNYHNGVGIFLIIRLQYEHKSQFLSFEFDSSQEGNYEKEYKKMWVDELDRPAISAGYLSENDIREDIVNFVNPSYVITIMEVRKINRFKI